GRYPESLGLMNKAIAAERSLAPIRELEIAGIEADRAVVLARLERNAEAKAAAEAALRVRERRLGPMHPVVGTTLTTLGQVLVSLRDRRRALEVLERSRSISVTLFGPRHPGLIAVLVSAGNALFEEGAHAEALARFEEARQLAVANRGPEHPSVGL